MQLSYAPSGRSGLLPGELCAANCRTAGPSVKRKLSVMELGDLNPMAGSSATRKPRIGSQMVKIAITPSTRKSKKSPGTRGKGEVSTGTNHLGFRCVKPGMKQSGG